MHYIPPFHKKMLAMVKIFNLYSGVLLARSSAIVFKAKHLKTYVESRVKVIFVSEYTMKYTSKLYEYTMKYTSKLM